MKRAEYKDKDLVVNILASSFQDNKSVNYIVKQDKKRDQRLRKLMVYSFDVCYLFGSVFLSENKQGCALILFPDKKKTTLRSILLDVRLIFSCTGLSNAKKAMAKEAKIKKLQLEELMYYLWFIGVHPDQQGAGTGTSLLKEIIRQGEPDKRMICLKWQIKNNITGWMKSDLWAHRIKEPLPRLNAILIELFNIKAKKSGNSIPVRKTTTRRLAKSK